MEFGVCLPNYGNNSSPETICGVAKAAEELGYDSIWTTDHLLLPSKYKYPYGRIFETITTLAYVAAITEKTRLGTSILVLPMRNAITVAKQLATIDNLSGGRVIAGLAVGWCEDEFKNLGVGHLFRKRGKLLDEQITLMRKIWREYNISFEGKFHKIEDGISDPRPIRTDGIEIWIGGNSEHAVRRALRLGDAWHFTGIPIDELDKRLETIRSFEKSGRRLRITGRFTIDFEGEGPKLRRAASGTMNVILGGEPQKLINQLEPYVERGVEYIVASFGDKKLDEVINCMKAFMREVAPSLSGR